VETVEVRVPCHGLVVLATQSAFCHGLFIVEVVVVPRAVLLALFWRHVKWLVSHEDMNIPPTDSQILMQTARSHNTPTPLPFPLLPPAARTPVPTHQPHAAPHNSNTKGGNDLFCIACSQASLTACFVPHRRVAVLQRLALVLCSLTNRGLLEPLAHSVMTQAHPNVSLAIAAYTEPTSHEGVHVQLCHIDGQSVAHVALHPHMRL